MEPRLSLLTLGVSDLDHARQFYERLGWRPTGPTGDIVFFQAGGMVVALWGRADLAADTGVEDGGGWGGITLAQTLRSREEVDAVLAEHSHGWALDRMPAVDLAILRVGLWELLYSDTPPAVIVDEAVALATTLSTDSSPRFVNGVLGTLLTLAPGLREAELPEH